MADHTKRPFESAISELERLRAIEQAAKALFPDLRRGAQDSVLGTCMCSVCWGERPSMKEDDDEVAWQSPRCLFTKLAQALGVKAEPNARST